MRLAPEGAAAALLGARGATLWVADLDAQDQPRVRWARQGSGTVHAVASGDVGDGFALWIAWGQSRGDRTAPIVLERVDPASGEAREVWRVDGPRREPVALSVTDVDGDGRRDLAFAYFATGHAVRTRDLLGGSAASEGAPLHMAMSRAFVDLDGDGRPDEVVGQLYDEDPGRVGKLRARVGEAWTEIPTSGGIRAVLPVAEAGRQALLFSDGWSKNYGKEGRARVSLARWSGSAFEVEAVGSSSGDVSFFELSTASSTTGLVVLARGDKTTWTFSREATAWAAREVARLAGSKSAVLVDRGEGRAPVAFDARRPGAPVAVGPAAERSSP